MCLSSFAFGIVQIRNAQIHPRDNHPGGATSNVNSFNVRKSVCVILWPFFYEVYACTKAPCRQLTEGNNRFLL